MINIYDENLKLDRISIFIKNTKYSPFNVIISGFEEKFGKYKYINLSSDHSVLICKYNFYKGKVLIRRTKHNTTMIDFTYSRLTLNKIRKILDSIATKIVDNDKIINVQLLSKCELCVNVSFPEKTYDEVEIILINLCKVIMPIDGYGQIIFIYKGENFGNCCNGDCNGKKTFYFYPPGRNGIDCTKKSKKPNSFFKAYCKLINNIWHIRLEITLKSPKILKVCEGKRLSIFNTIDILLNKKVKDFWQFGTLDLDQTINFLNYKSSSFNSIPTGIEESLNAKLITEKFADLKLLTKSLDLKYSPSEVKEKFFTQFSPDDLAKYLGG